MVYFVKCEQLKERSYGRDSILTNNPVNLSNCTHISKSRVAWYPDNHGNTINQVSYDLFHMINKDNDINWVFKTDEFRDIEFERISNTQAIHMENSNEN